VLMKQAPPDTGKRSVVTPARLGFHEVHTPQSDRESPIWKKDVGGREVTFRFLRTVGELAVAEYLQRDVFGVSDVEIVSAGELVVVHETGGEVIAAFGEQDGVEQPLGCLIGWGGYFDRRPRVVSDFMGVRRDVRSGGIGTELKRLQAAIALERGFVEIVWTFDPLRAPNAWLNFEKLGAYSDHYEENRYGSFAPELYGDMPTDRLFVTWPIAAPNIQERLLAPPAPRSVADLAGVDRFDAKKLEVERALIHIPKDIDRVLADDPPAALEWRLRLRNQLPRAFAAGLAITGFAPDADPERELAAYLIERKSR
jgi:predicted GNAT superfamily acetyltransferase